jgi:hypothetical protein
MILGVVTAGWRNGTTCRYIIPCCCITPVVATASFLYVKNYKYGSQAVLNARNKRSLSSQSKQTREKPIPPFHHNNRETGHALQHPISPVSYYLTRHRPRPPLSAHLPLPLGQRPRRRHPQHNEHHAGDQSEKPQPEDPAETGAARLFLLLPLEPGIAIGGTC